MAKCKSVSGLFPNRVLFPTTSDKESVPEFQMIHSDRWSKTSILSPSCIFLPSRVEELSAAMKTLATGNCLFAIKSGGHNPIPGANDINKGVSIDLRYLNQTTLAPDRSFVSLGAGGNWMNAYNAFADDGVGFPGGLCGMTGVGGVTIG